MKKTILMVLALMLSVTTFAADEYGKYYHDMPSPMKQVAAPIIPSTRVSLSDFGAKGDGITLNSDAFRKAISTLAKQGGGHLDVPAGVWLTGPIALKDNIDLHLDKNAIIMFSPDKSLYITDDDGKKLDKSMPLINASKRRNVCITGEGIIDGGGAQWRPVKKSKVSDAEWKEFKYMGGTEADGGTLWFPFGLKHQENIAATPEAQEKMRADLIRITDCENVLLQGVVFQNSPRFHVHPVRCTNVIIDGITVQCPWNAQNGDGIDLSNCKTVLIVNSTVNVGDDGICMKGGSGVSGEEDGPCEDILIERNTVFHAHGGFVIGSDVSGGMKNIVVRNCRFSGTDTGLRFKSAIGRGGKTENIRISNIVMNDIKEEAVTFECTYVDKKYKSGDAKASQKVNEPYSPDFADIHISDVVCRGCKTAVSAHGLEGMKCVHDIHISNSVFFYTDKAQDMDNTVDVNIKDVKFVTFDK